MSESNRESTGPAFNTQPAGLEKWVDQTVKQLPAIPANGRKWLADNAWWLALVGGILSVWGLWSMWQAANLVNQLGAWADRISASYGVATTSSQLGVMWYAALAAMAVQAVLMFLAFQPLKEHKKSGWNLLFYSSLVSLVVGVVYLFVPAYGISSLLGMVVGTAIGWYILFNIRGHFTK